MILKTAQNLTRPRSRPSFGNWKGLGDMNPNYGVNAPKAHESFLA
jgi:hypothetical protein